ncbi:unnamed protein product [Symbiodinium sp. CCMP2456]|nr:unnamed protein product [Symbiodinium sp. CCMP2456]
MGTDASERYYDKLSKALSAVLRHTGRQDGLYFTRGGFARIQDIFDLQLLRLKAVHPGHVYDLAETSFHKDGCPRFEIHTGPDQQDWVRSRRRHSMAGIRASLQAEITWQDVDEAKRHRMNLAEQQRRDLDAVRTWWQDSPQAANEDQIGADRARLDASSVILAELAQPPAITSDVVGRATCDFSGAEFADDTRDESAYLTLQKGEYVINFGHGQDGWCWGRTLVGEEGWFPQIFFEPAQTLLEAEVEESAASPGTSWEDYNQATPGSVGPVPEQPQPEPDDLPREARRQSAGESLFGPGTATSEDSEAARPDPSENAPLFQASWPSPLGPPTSYGPKAPVPSWAKSASQPAKAPPPPPPARKAPPPQPPRGSPRPSRTLQPPPPSRHQPAEYPWKHPEARTPAHHASPLRPNVAKETAPRNPASSSSTAVNPSVVPPSSAASRASERWEDGSDVSVFTKLHDVDNSASSSAVDPYVTPPSSLPPKTHEPWEGGSKLPASSSSSWQSQAYPLQAKQKQPETYSQLDRRHVMPQRGSSNPSFEGCTWHHHRGDTMGRHGSATVPNKKLIAADERSHNARGHDALQEPEAGTRRTRQPASSPQPEDPEPDTGLPPSTHQTDVVDTDTASRRGNASFAGLSKHFVHPTDATQSDRQDCYSAGNREETEGPVCRDAGEGVEAAKRQAPAHEAGSIIAASSEDVLADDNSVHQASMHGVRSGMSDEGSCPAMDDGYEDVATPGLAEVDTRVDLSGRPAKLNQPTSQVSQVAATLQRPGGTPSPEQNDAAVLDTCEQNDLAGDDEEFIYPQPGLVRQADKPHIQPCSEDRMQSVLTKIFRETNGPQIFENNSVARKITDQDTVLEVDSVKYTHDRISKRFKHGPHAGEPIEHLVRDITEGRVDPLTEPRLRLKVVRHGSQYYSLNNRRLHALKEARATHLSARVYDMDPITAKFLMAFSTTSDGADVQVGGHSHACREGGVHHGRDPDMQASHPADLNREVIVDNKSVQTDLEPDAPAVRALQAPRLPEICSASASSSSSEASSRSLDRLDPEPANDGRRIPTERELLRVNADEPFPEELSELRRHHGRVVSCRSPGTPVSQEGEKAYFDFCKSVLALRKKPNMRMLDHLEEKDIVIGFLLQMADNREAHRERVREVLDALALCARWFAALESNEEHLQSYKELLQPSRKPRPRQPVLKDATRTSNRQMAARDMCAVSIGEILKQVEHWPLEPGDRDRRGEETWKKVRKLVRHVDKTTASREEPAQPAQPSNGHSRADVNDTLKDFLTFAAMFASERKTYKRDIAEVLSPILNSALVQELRKQLKPDVCKALNALLEHGFGTSDP